jgi:hypothetical protein
MHIHVERLGAVHLRSNRLYNARFGIELDARTANPFKAIWDEAKDRSDSKQ